MSQENGEFPASKSVEDARFAKFKQVKQNIKSEDAERLLEAKGIKVLPYGQ